VSGGNFCTKWVVRVGCLGWFGLIWFGGLWLVVDLVVWLEESLLSYACGGFHKDGASTLYGNIPVYRGLAGSMFHFWCPVPVSVRTNE